MISHILGINSQENYYFLDKLKNHGRALSGVALGIIFGSGMNYFFNHSLFSRDPLMCYKFSRISFVGAINDWREKQFDFFVDHLSYACCLPAIQLISIVAAAFWNTFRQKNHTDLKSEAAKFAKNILNPLYVTLEVGFIAHFVRKFTNDFFKSYRIDISGHMIAQTMIALHSLNFVEGITKIGSPLQRRVFSVIHDIMMLTDFIWVFNTAANCHSVVDVVAGLAIPIFIYMAVEMSKELSNNFLNRLAI